MWNAQGNTYRVTTADTAADSTPLDDLEDLPSLLRSAFDAYPDLLQKDVAERAGVSPATLSAWITGTRGNAGRIAHDRLRALAEALPSEYTVARVFRAAGRRVPASVNTSRREQLLDTYDQLTEKQQRALVEIADVLRRAD